ncbi:hypothetical protein DUE52_16945 [Larkinella punicea]|uniref:Uncharacterized protein n=1 Tax=Larkinella punicea TaxID=2315727 RepID=A0A368JPA6_9BACT|nr:hypothetical protein DUE52_16945 [Larkinella punicea]
MTQKAKPVTELLKNITELTSGQKKTTVLVAIANRDQHLTHLDQRSKKSQLFSKTTKGKIVQ